MPSNLKDEFKRLAQARKIVEDARKALERDGDLTAANERPFNDAMAAFDAIECRLAELHGRRDFQKP